LHGGPPIDPEARDLADDSWVLERMKQYTEKHFPGLEPTPHIVEPCIYTVLNNVLDQEGNFLSFIKNSFFFQFIVKFVHVLNNNRNYDLSWVFS